MRLIGYVDGVEVAFDFYHPNIFKATIPKRLNGRYIVELKAIDEAGNETNTADIYIYIDFQKMRFKVLDDNYKFILDDKGLGYIKIKDIYSSKELACNFNYKEIYSQYSYRELVIV